MMLADVADVRLCVDGERRLLPGLQLPGGHGHERALRRGEIVERIGKSARVSLAPETVLHQVDPFDERVAVESRGEQIVQLRKRLLEFRVIVAGLDEFGLSEFGNATDLHQRDARAQELRERQLTGLEFGIGQLDPERHSETVPPGRIQRQIPDGMQIECAGS